MPYQTTFMMFNLIKGILCGWKTFFSWVYISNDGFLPPPWSPCKIACSLIVPYLLSLHRPWTLSDQNCPNYFTATDQSNPYLTVGSLWSPGTTLKLFFIVTVILRLQAARCLLCKCCLSLWTTLVQSTLNGPQLRMNNHQDTISR